MIRISNHLIALFIAFLTLSGCSNKEAPETMQSKENAEAPTQLPPAAVAAQDLDEAELMHAVFGEDYNAEQEEALTELSDQENSDQLYPYLVRAWGHTTLPGGETLLLTNAEVPDNNGDSVSSHGTPGLLSLYVLRNQDGKWKVVKRHELFDALGSHGSAGAAYWVQLGKGKTGLAMKHGGIWQGYTLSSLSLYDVSDGNIRSLTEDTISLHSDNEGDCTEEKHCWDYDGEWKFVPSSTHTDYDDLLIEFTGKEMGPVEGVTKNTPTASIDYDAYRVKKKPFKVQALYRFKEGSYQLIQGRNLASERN